MLDVDLRKWFDSIPHSCLREVIEGHPFPRSVKKYLESTLTAPCVDPRGHPSGETPRGVQRPTCGTPQGGVLSPLWSNLVATVVDKFLEEQDILHCRYADNIVICLPVNWSLEMKRMFKVDLERILPEGCRLHPGKERWSNVLTTLGYFINTQGSGLYYSHHKYKDKDVLTREGEVQTSEWSKLAPKVRWYKELVGRINISCRRLTLSRLYREGTLLFNNWKLIHPEWLSPLTYESEVMMFGGGTRPGVSYIHDYTGYVTNLGKTNSYWNLQFKPKNRSYQFSSYLNLNSFLLEQKNPAQTKPPVSSII